MKPHESGIIFENLAEIAAAEQALGFVASLGQFPGKSQAELEVLAVAVENQHAGLRAFRSLQDGAPECSLTIKRPAAEHLIRRALELTTTQHPDEDLRTATRNMLNSYQAAQDDPPEQT